jgi:hypothetical protein
MDRNMGETTGKPAAGKPASSRDDRLKAALKANIARRKAQAKARTKPGAEKEAADGFDTGQGQRRTSG